VHIEPLHVSALGLTRIVGLYHRHHIHYILITSYRHIHNQCWHKRDACLPLTYL